MHCLRALALLERGRQDVKHECVHFRVQEQHLVLDNGDPDPEQRVVLLAFGAEAN